MYIKVSKTKQYTPTQLGTVLELSVSVKVAPENWKINSFSLLTSLGYSTFFGKKSSFKDTGSLESWEGEKQRKSRGVFDRGEEQRKPRTLGEMGGTQG